MSTTLTPASEAALQAIEASTDRDGLTVTVNSLNLRTVRELAQYLECYEGLSRAPKDMLAEAVADAAWARCAGGQAEAHAAAAAGTQARLDAIDADLAGLTVGTVAPSTDPIVQAKAEAKAAKAATKAAAKPAATPGTPKPKANWMPRYTEALAAKKAKARPACYPVAMTLEDRVAYIANVLATTPNADCWQAHEIAAWVDGQRMSRTGWAKAWEAATAPVQAEATDAA